jgi:hypothetical protein
MVQEPHQTGAADRQCVAVDRGAAGKLRRDHRDPEPVARG